MVKSPRITTNADAVKATLGELRASERLTPADAALAQAATTLAQAVDENPEHASLWAQYLKALEQLRGVGAVDDGPSDVDKLLSALGAPLGDSQDA